MAKKTAKKTRKITKDNRPRPKGPTVAQLTAAIEACEEIRQKEAKARGEAERALRRLDQKFTQIREVARAAIGAMKEAVRTLEGDLTPLEEAVTAEKMRQSVAACYRALGEIEQKGFP